MCIASKIAGPPVIALITIEARRNWIRAEICFRLTLTKEQGNSQCYLYLYPQLNVLHGYYVKHRSLNNRKICMLTRFLNVSAAIGSGILTGEIKLLNIVLEEAKEVLLMLLAIKKPTSSMCWFKHLMKLVTFSIIYLTRSHWPTEGLFLLQFSLSVS